MVAMAGIVPVDNLRPSRDIAVRTTMAD
jgi:hypothetical protein